MRWLTPAVVFLGVVLVGCGSEDGFGTEDRFDAGPADGLTEAPDAIGANDIIFQDNFDSYTDSPLAHGWKEFGSRLEMVTTGCYRDTRCARVNYTARGTTGYWFGTDVGSHDLQELYVRFYFKVEGDPSQGGSKFLKLFGKENAPEGYANSTFALTYTEGRLKEVSYGSGSGITNDTQSVIRLANGAVSDSGVTVEYHRGQQFVPVPGTWYHFEVHMKYNSDGLRDGLYEIWIGSAGMPAEPWLRVTNVKNRNDLNSPHFKRVDFANYTNATPTTPWRIYYDEIVIAESRIGP
jgi:hypothetical protein